MEYTSGLKLRKPQKGANADAVDIDDFNFNFDKLDVAINGITIVTIPADNQDTENPNYTEINDGEGGEGGNTYYSITIPVQGMTSNYVGSNAVDYVRPNPFNVEENEELRDLFGLILDIESGNGTITILVSEIPSKSFQIYLYGIGTVTESNNANTNNSEIIEEPEEQPVINPISQEIYGPGGTNPNP